MGCVHGTNQVSVLGEPNSKNKVDDKNRNGSATSKASRHSGDSGFDDEEALVAEQMMIQRDILSRPILSGKGSATKERVEERTVLETLHEEGLIQRPIARRAFGVSFEVLTDGTEGATILKRPPARLAKLEEVRKKKRKPLTEAQIREKLRRAEERKKEHEQLRLAKIQSLHKTSDAPPTARDIFGAPSASTYLEEAPKSKEEIAAENREKKLKERLERLQKKKEHAAEVRRRKREAAAAAAASGTLTGEVNDAFAGVQTDAGGNRVNSGVTREALARSLEAGVANSAGKSGRHA